MQLFSKLALPALISLGACGSSSETARATRDASDATAPAPTPDGAKPRADAATMGGGGDVVEAGQTPRDAGDPTTSFAHFVYVGGWKDGDYPYRTYAVDPATLTLTQVGAVENLGNNPSFAVGSGDGRHLYVANESWSGQPALTVASLGLNGAATRSATVSLPGAGSPVFTSVTPSGSFLLAADIRVGQVLVLKLADGQLGPVVDAAVITQAGSASAETHSVVVHPSGKWVYAPNKATDRIAQFALDGSTGKLTPLSPALVAGEDEPRILAVHPSGELAYVMHEKSSVLVAFRVGAGGALTRLAGDAAVTSTLPAGFTGTSTGAHVAVHPSGKFLYASNRGDDSIAAFAIADDGALRLLGHTKSGGRIPRHFALTARGEVLVVANQGADGASDGTLVAFAIGDDGKLSRPGPAISGLPQPTSATIVSRAQP